MKFGDLVINEWAGDANPHKILMFVRKTPRRIYCVARDGDSVEFFNDKNLKLTQVGNLDLSHWDSRITRLSMQDKEDAEPEPCESEKQS